MLGGYQLYKHLASHIKLCECNLHRFILLKSSATFVDDFKLFCNLQYFCFQD